MKHSLLAVTLALLALVADRPAIAEAKQGSSAGPKQTQIAQARVYYESDAPVHGIAADKRVAFVTQPAIEPGATSRVVALNARTGRELGEVPPPPGGFRFPFAVRVLEGGRLAVLDNAGFPPRGAPKVYEYSYSERDIESAQLTRTVDFTGLPLLFAEDLEVMPDGGYVVSESIIGALWLVGADGSIRPGLLPSGPAPLPQLAGCAHPSGNMTVGEVPFISRSGFAPGVGSLAISDDHLYFGSSCQGGLHRIELDTLTDLSRSSEERAAEIETVSPRPAGVDFESLKGLAVDPGKRGNEWIYAGDPFQLRLLRINPDTGERQVVSTDSRLFNFSVAATFTRTGKGHGASRLLVTSDQEYRWAALNAALTQDAFQPPFLVTEVKVR